MITETSKDKDIDFIKEINDLLEFEKQINLKKLKGEKLTNKEYIFDTYVIKPSILIKYMYSKKEELDV